MVGAALPIPSAEPGPRMLDDLKPAGRASLVTAGLHIA